MEHFFENTKNSFKSCKFACINNYGPRKDWNVWGEFTSRKQALEVGKMWTYSFRGKLEISIVGNRYRVVVSY